MWVLVGLGVGARPQGSAIRSLLFEVVYTHSFANPNLDKNDQNWFNMLN